MSLESIIRKVLSTEVQETTITNEDLAPGVECDCQCGKVPCVECGKDHHKHEKEGISEDTLDEHFDDLNIQEGVWHYPDAKDIAKFKKALSKKFIVGKVGYPAKDIIPFGDDELYDMLDDASDNNPKQDARPIFTRWINGRIRDNYGGYGKKTLAIAKQLGIREGVEKMSDENLEENAFRPPHMTKKDVDVQKAKKLMDPAKNRGDGINRIMKGMKLDKAKATKLHDLVMKKDMGEEVSENSDAKRFGLSQSLVDAVASIIGGKQPTNAPAKKEDASNNKSDDGEGLDKADPKAAKKKFKDRKDKDIDNDGDTDDSDKFLHKKRKAIGKSMDKEEPKADAKSDKEDDADTKADPKKKKGKQEPVDTKPTMNAEAKIMEDQVPRDKDGNLVKKPGYLIKLKLGKGYVYVRDTGQGLGNVRGGQGMSGRSSSGGVGVREMKEDMSDEQMKKREEIMKELKKKEGYFKEKYGEKWEEVMYATATKMATK